MHIAGFGNGDKLYMGSSRNRISFLIQIYILNWTKKGDRNVQCGESVLLPSDGSEMPQVVLQNKTTRDALPSPITERSGSLKCSDTETLFEGTCSKEFHFHLHRKTVREVTEGGQKPAFENSPRIPDDPESTWTRWSIRHGVALGGLPPTWADSLQLAWPSTITWANRLHEIHCTVCSLYIYGDTDIYRYINTGMHAALLKEFLKNMRIKILIMYLLHAHPSSLFIYFYPSS